MKRILFIGMVDAIHAVRWTSHLTGQDWEIFFFPVARARLHPGFRELTIFNPNLFPGKYPAGNKVRLLPWVSPLFFLQAKLPWILKRPISGPVEKALEWVIRTYKPDIVHSLEFQLAGYLTQSIKERMGDKFPTWIATIWGSDIYLFGKLQKHKARIQSILASCDYFGSETERDISLARSMGLSGKVLPILPASGAFDLEYCKKFQKPGPVSERRTILLKGYQHFAGRALVGIRALALCADALQGYRVAIFGATPDVQVAAELFSLETKIPVDIISTDRHEANDEDILRAFGNTRISIGLSISDGIPRGLLDAMIMGAYPIQSNTSAADEWIVDGRNGSIVPPEDPHIIADTIRLALTNDTLVDNAAEINWDIARKRLTEQVIRPKVIEMYKEILK